MENKKLFTKEELLNFNEMMLGRGMPVTEDGVGYNKADFGACSTYFYGVSNAQLTDLAKRLVKYCNTQLGVDKEMMKDTYNELAEISKGEDRTDGVSLNITETGTLISFRYNELFIETIKKHPRRQWDGENKNWIVPNKDLVNVLLSLEEVGADIKNAMEYALAHELMNVKEEVKVTEVLTKFDGEYALLKFDYNKDILSQIKTIDIKDREWNKDYKFWLIRKECFEGLKEKLSSVATFKLV
jgi:hypothetical protein